MQAVRVEFVSGWFGVRCVFELDGELQNHLYEERVTIWRADHADEAIRLAETEASDYAGAIDARYLGLAQCYTLVDEPGVGAEVFSLVRESTLQPDAYLDSHFDTGGERQTEQRG